MGLGLILQAIHAKQKNRGHRLTMGTFQKDIGPGQISTTLDDHRHYFDHRPERYHRISTLPLQNCHRRSNHPQTVPTIREMGPNFAHLAHRTSPTWFCKLIPFRIDSTIGNS